MDARVWTPEKILSLIYKASLIQIKKVLLTNVSELIYLDLFTFIQNLVPGCSIRIVSRQFKGHNLFNGRGAKLTCHLLWPPLSNSYVNLRTPLFSRVEILWPPPIICGHSNIISLPIVTLLDVWDWAFRIIEISLCHHRIIGDRELVIIFRELSFFTRRDSQLFG